MNALPRLLGGIALAAFAVASPAGTRQASFDVVIRLLAYPGATPEAAGTCTGGTTSGSSDATVSVVCSGEEFVVIAPVSSALDTPMLGRTHRFRLDGRQTPHPLTVHMGSSGVVGQVTALRVINIQGQSTALHVRVDF